MDKKTFMALPPLDQIISLCGMTPPDMDSAKHLMALVNTVARGATGDLTQKFVDETISMVFGEEETIDKTQ